MAALPAAIIDTNRRRAAGVQVWEERIEADAIGVVDDMRVTMPARTALDLARRYPTDVAVAAIDALAQAVEVKLADIELLVDRYQGRRGMKAARATLELVDGGAQSSKETWLRLSPASGWGYLPLVGACPLLLRAGLPRPQTQVAVRNEWGWPEAYLDMSWEDIKVAVEYDGDLGPPPACGGHRSSRAQYVKDIRRLEMAERMGWIVGPGDSKKAQKTAPRTLSTVCAKHERTERNASAKTAISQWRSPRKRVVPPAGAARQNVRPAAGD